MGIISTLKAVLGVGDDRRADRGTSVTVERDAGSVEEAPAAGTASTAPAERAVKGLDDESLTEDEERRPTPSGSGESVDEIKGIGAAYAERLEAAGVSTVAELAAADAAELAEETGLGAGRIEGWIEQARARTE